MISSVRRIPIHGSSLLKYVSDKLNNNFILRTVRTFVAYNVLVIGFTCIIRGNYEVMSSPDLRIAFNTPPRHTVMCVVFLLYSVVICESIILMSWRPPASLNKNTSENNIRFAIQPRVVSQCKSAIAFVVIATIGDICAVFLNSDYIFTLSIIAQIICYVGILFQWFRLIRFHGFLVLRR